MMVMMLMIISLPAAVPAVASDESPHARLESGPRWKVCMSQLFSGNLLKILGQHFIRIVVCRQYWAWFR